MPELQSIALTQIALWYDPTRIQTWPRFLALLPEGAMAPTPTDLGRTFVTGRMTSEKHSAAFNRCEISGPRAPRRSAPASRCWSTRAIDDGVPAEQSWARTGPLLCCGSRGVALAVSVR